MDIFQSVIFTVHIFSALAVIFLVLMQQGKGADVGASFGGGVSGSVFGAGGSANFLSRTTAVLATLFFVTSLGLTYLGSGGEQVKASGGLMDQYQAVETSKPAAIPNQAAQPTTAPAQNQAAKPAPEAPASSPLKPNAIPN